MSHTRHSLLRSTPRLAHGDRARPIWREALIAVATGVTIACAGTDSDTTIERQAFVETYSELRIAAFQTDSQRVGAPERDEILARHGVTEQDLEVFVQVHATDVEFMRDVWNDVELMMEKQPEVGN